MNTAPGAEPLTPRAGERLAAGLDPALAGLEPVVLQRTVLLTVHAQRGLVGGLLLVLAQFLGDLVPAVDDLP